MKSTPSLSPEPARTTSPPPGARTPASGRSAARNARRPHDRARSAHLRGGARGRSRSTAIAFIASAVAGAGRFAPRAPCTTSTSSGAPRSAISNASARCCAVASKGRVTVAPNAHAGRSLTLGLSGRNQPAQKRRRRSARASARESSSISEAFEARRACGESFVMPPVTSKGKRTLGSRTVTSSTMSRQPMTAGRASSIPSPSRPIASRSASAAPALPLDRRCLRQDKCPRLCSGHSTCDHTRQRRTRGKTPPS